MRRTAQFVFMFKLGSLIKKVISLPKGLDVIAWFAPWLGQIPIA